MLASTVGGRRGLRGLEAIAPFIVAGGTRDGFGGELDFLRILASAGKKAADNERSVMARL